MKRSSMVKHYTERENDIWAAKFILASSIPFVILGGICISCGRSDLSVLPAILSILFIVMPIITYFFPDV